MKLYDLRADLSVCCAFLFRDPFMWGGGESGWFDGTPRGDTYPIAQGKRSEERVDGPLPDYTDFGLRPIPAFSERAIDALGLMLRPHGEFAAIEMDEPVCYFAFNPTTIVDVLDEEQSEIARFRSGGVMAVDRHVLRASVQTLPPIFKIPQTRRNTTYVTEEFRDQVRRAELTGFDLELLFQRQ